GTLVTFSQFNASAAGAAARPAEIEFRGTKGTLYAQSHGYEIVPEAISQDEFPARSPLTRETENRYRAGVKPLIEPKKVAADRDSGDTALHARNFLDCVKSRAKCNCDIETGHRSTTTTLIANTALQTRATLAWDAHAERFINNDAANKLLDCNYRAPYKLS